MRACGVLTDEIFSRRLFNAAARALFFSAMKQNALLSALAIAALGALSAPQAAVAQSDAQSETPQSETPRPEARSPDAPSDGTEEGGGLSGGLDLLSRGSRMILRGLMDDLQPLLKGLDSAIDDVDAYHLPEVLPNGDIIIRRKIPLVPETPEEGEVEL